MAFSVLTDGLSAELEKPGSQKQGVKEGQRDKDSYDWKMRVLGYERTSEAFARINEGIHQDDLLEDGKVS